MTERTVSKAAIRTSGLERLVAKQPGVGAVAVTISCLESGIFLHANEAFCRMTGYSREEIIGRSSVDFGLWVSGRDRDDFCRRLVENGNLSGAEYAFRCATGELRYAQLSAELFQADGRQYLLTMAVDLTDQRRLREALERSEPNLLRSGRAVPDIALIVDEEGRLVDVLAVPGKDLLLYDSAEKLRGKRIHDVFPASEADAFVNVVHQTLDTQSPQVHRYALEVQAGIRWFEARIAPISGAQGLRHVVWVACDVTDEKRAEEELVSAAERRKRLARELIRVQERERKHIAQELHDDLGQLLTAIELEGTSIFQRAEDPEAVRQHVVRLETRLSAAMESVRTLAQGLHPKVLDDLGLGAALESLCTALSKPGLDIRVTLDEGVSTLPPEAAGALYRIAQEALNNTVRHARATEVSLALRIAEGMVELAVADNGVGAPAAVAERTQGSGMGLAGMRERASILGGDLSIDASPGAGFRVTAHIPCC